jgi:hypothetical protein
LPDAGTKSYQPDVYQLIERQGISHMATKKAPAKSLSILQGCSGPSKTDQQRYQAESDLRTIQSMAELRGDKSRIQRAEALLKTQMKAVQGVK